MVAIMQLHKQAPEHVKTEKAVGAVGKLKQLHAEAEETARLANILGRSLYAGIVLPVLAILAVGLSVDVNPVPQLFWCLFVGAVAVALLVAYRRAMRRPFERPSLKEFTKDLSAILLFAGFAWGSGAFLALPVGTTAAGALLFVTVPAASVAFLLRDRRALLLFLAPTTVLATAACLIKPFEGDITLASMVVVTSVAIATITFVYERVAGLQNKPAMLSLP